MAGEEVAEGSGTRRMDLGLPPLPPPRVRVDTSAASPALMPSSTGAAPEVPRTGEPEESLAPMAAAYSPSNALSAPEEHPTLDPIVYSWLDGGSSAGSEEYTDALRPPAPAYGLNASGPANWSVGEDDLLAARSVRPSRLAAAGAVGMEMVNVSTPRQSTRVAAATPIEAGAPELRFLRLIQISQQHNTADSLARAIQQSHCSLEAARVRSSDGGDNSSFECNICLEVARQPVVTSCGHLFCWPCLHQWFHAQTPITECPVCKGEVPKGDITPIYGRGGEEGGSAANPNLPPRPGANRRESLRHQLQMAGMAGNNREMARVLRQLIQNQNQGWDATPVAVETTSVPGAQRRAGTRRQERQVTSESSNPIQLPDSNGDNAAQVVIAPPQPSSSAAAIVGEPGPSRRSRRLVESATTRRTRTRPQ